MNEFVRRAYDEVADEYLLARRDDQQDLPLVDALVRHLPPGAAVLDVGCGAGLPISAHLASAGFHVIGIDISERQIDLARKNVPDGEFHVRDMSQLTEGEFHVAAVVAFYSIFHIPRQGHSRLLSILRTFLGAGGRLLCTFGSTEWEGEEPFFGTPMRWSHFGPDASAELVAEAGFDVEYAEIVERRLEGEIERHLVVSALAV